MLFDTRARLMPRTSPTCFFAEPWTGDFSLADLFRVEAAPLDPVGTALLRVAPEWRCVEDVVFLAKLSPLSHVAATKRLHCTLALPVRS
jgi:hypothetical protein